MSAPPRDTLNIRIKPEQRGLIDRAAALVGKTRTDFVLDASTRAAEETLMDRVLFTVGEDTYARFLEQLDAPPSANPRLKRTMTSPAPWDDA